jgi:hypothetical protein
MNPEEKALLNELKKISEENNHILQKIQKSLRWWRIWGFVKVLIIVIPLIVGYIYLIPYMEAFKDSFKEIMNLVPILNSVPR